MSRSISDGRCTWHSSVGVNLHIEMVIDCGDMAISWYLLKLTPSMTSFDLFPLLSVCPAPSSHPSLGPLRFGPLPHIVPHIVVTRVCLLVYRLLRLRSSWSFEISCFGGAGHELAMSVFDRILEPVASTDWPDPPFSPGLEIKSPPSSTGISRLSPAPEAAEPTVMVLPGNLFVTLVSTPDSVARRYQLNDGIERSGCFYLSLHYSRRVWLDGN